ncbi:hypothetical protein BN874_540021 [Candidatus Contendobacter odensis Run_B_J11]|uniref:Uncharacterized protein n=1 Tax=Candidatus Contendobacter odensis Run_B_J11 TaxID=1400861 RepID=A0A7U7GEJ8_9GAMM|nr:hypothetical protein BN874_540021 [Candidatus Contendobacter odensis Run_B_J11]
MNDGLLLTPPAVNMVKKKSKPVLVYSFIVYGPYAPHIIRSDPKNHGKFLE